MFDDDADENDDMVEICVESLVGTAFEMRLSKHETFANIKARLQRLEGIPRHQMHLLYRARELPDSSTLAESGIESGSTLRLVLSLRGGPINTRRVQMNSQKPRHDRHLEDIMQNSRGQLMDRIPQNGQLTVLLFREGDHVNLFHVLERPDGSYTPLSTDSMSGSSIRNLFNESDDDPSLAERLRENKVTMSKMSELKAQMENLQMKKREKRQSHKKSSGRKSARTKVKNVRTKTNPNLNQSFSHSLTGKVALPPIQPRTNQNNTHIDDLMSSSTTSTSTTTLLPFQSTSNHFLRKRHSNSDQPPFPDLTSKRTDSDIPEWLKRHNLERKHSESGTYEKNPKNGNNNSTIDVIDLKMRPNESQLEIVRTRKTQKLISTDISGIREVENPVLTRRQTTRTRRNTEINSDQSEDNLDGSKGSSDRSKASHVLSQSKDHNQPSARALIQDVRLMNKDNDEFLDLQPAATSTPRFGRRARIHSESKDETSRTLNNSMSSDRWQQSRGNSSRNTQGRSSRQQRSSATYNAARPLSSMAASRKARKKTPKPRCGFLHCRKKLNITNGFPCRCQQVFCAKHRHPEIHDCSFDYKEEGKKDLAKAVPLITFPKLPKI